MEVVTPNKEVGLENDPIQETAAVALPVEQAPAAESDGRNRALESKALHATLWTVIDYGSSMSLRVVNSLVLTHLLMPEYFGLMTLVTTLVVGVSLMSDIGLTPSIVRSPRGDDPLFLNTAFTVQALRGIGIFVISLLVTWPFARFYHEPRLLTLLPVISFTIVISSFNSTNLLSMSRHMGVRRVFIFDFSAQFLTFIATAGFAYFYPSVWALVVGQVVAVVYRLIMSHNQWLLPGIKNKFAWDRESVHELVHFGKWIVLSTAFYFFASQSDRLILGKLVSFAMLGVYGIAYSISDIPRAIINAFTQKVGFPFISKFVDRPVEEFRQIFLRYRLSALLVGGLMLTLMVHLGGFVITHVYDHRYAAAAWMVPILALGLWHTLLYSTTMMALFALGKSKYAGLGNGAYCAAVIVGILLGFHFFGMVGAVVAIAAGDFPLYVVITSGASREKVSSWRQDLLATLAFLAMLAVGLGLRKLITG